MNNTEYLIGMTEKEANKTTYSKDALVGYGLAAIASAIVDLTRVLRKEPELYKPDP